ncbi:MAG: cysteine desulfurase [Calditrichaceae bacterium]|nr:cysteine desulfurase [Calditrichaceae bacterium]MBN2710035.1 cysteine desulfurase [Calditrichaceae bacterium]RQV92135.1 MAG: cysteine desulfurase [Calditrichota bacterium]
MNNQNAIYFDYAASTPVDPQVLKSMLPYFNKYYGNPGGTHSYSRHLAEQAEACRTLIAKGLNIKPSEIIFMASATEANNTIFNSIARDKSIKGKHILISAIEHPSVTKPAEILADAGFKVEKIPVDSTGLVEPDKIEKQLREDTVLVSVMHVNNETGAIQPIDQIGRLCRQHGILFHTDTAQSFGKIKIDLNRINADYISISSHKLYGPLGCGLLYCRTGKPLMPLLYGGGQEYGRRSSTLNVPGIIGLGAAFKIFEENRENEINHLTSLKKYFMEKLSQTIADWKINSPEGRSFPGIISISFKNLNAEILNMQLNKNGFAVSTGSACSSGSMKPSSVLSAMGVAPEWIKGSIRFSFGRFTTIEQIDRLMQILPDLVQKVKNTR